MRRLADALGTGNTALVVTGLMLPIGGVIERFTAMALVAGFADPWGFSVSEAPAVLAALGASPVLLMVASIGLGLFAARVYDRRRLPLIFIVLVVLSIPMAAITSRYLGVGAAVSLACLIIATAWLAFREFAPSGPDWKGPPKGIRGGPLVVVLVVIYGLSAVAYGFGGRLGTAAQVTSADKAVLQDGYYLVVGQRQGFTLVAPCNNPGLVVEVPASAFSALTWQRPDHVRPGSSVTDPYRWCP